MNENLQPDRQSYDEKIQEEQRRIDALDATVDQKVESEGESEQLTHTYIGKINTLQEAISQVRNTAEAQKDSGTEGWSDMEQRCTAIEKKLYEKLWDIDRFTVGKRSAEINIAVDTFLEEVDGLQEQHENDQQATSVEEVFRSWGAGAKESKEAATATLAIQELTRIDADAIRSIDARLHLLEALPASVREKITGSQQLPEKQVIMQTLADASFLERYDFLLQPIESGVQSVKELYRDKQYNAEKQLKAVTESIQNETQTLLSDAKRLKSTERLQGKITEIEALQAQSKTIQEEYSRWSIAIASVDIALTAYSAAKAQSSGSADTGKRLLARSWEQYGSTLQAMDTSGAAWNNAWEAIFSLRREGKLSAFEQRLYGKSYSYKDALNSAVKRQKAVGHAVDLLDQVQRSPNGTRGFLLKDTPATFLKGTMRNAHTEMVLKNIEGPSGTTFECINVTRMLPLLNMQPPEGCVLILKHDLPQTQIQKSTGENGTWVIEDAYELQESDLAYARIEDGSLIVEDLQVRNEKKYKDHADRPPSYFYTGKHVSRSAAEQYDASSLLEQRDMQSRDILRTLHRDPDMQNVTTSGAKLFSSLQSMQQLFQVGMSVEKTKPFVDFAQNNALPILRMLESGELQQSVASAREKLVMLKEMNMGMALGGVEEQINAQIEALDAMTEQLANDQVLYIYRSITDMSIFHEDTWAKWMQNDLPKLVVVVGSVVAAMGLTMATLASYGITAPLALTAAGAAVSAGAGLVVDQAWDEAAYQYTHYTNSDIAKRGLRYSKRSQLGAWAAGNEFFNPETGQYEHPTFLEHVADPYTKNFLMTFATTAGTMQFGRVLLKAAENAQWVQALRKAITKNPIAASKIVQVAQKMQDIGAKRIPKVVLEWGDELMDECIENLIVHAAGSDARLQPFAALLTIVGKGGVRNASRVGDQLHMEITVPESTNVADLESHVPEGFTVAKVETDHVVLMSPGDHIQLKLFVANLQIDDANVSPDDGKSTVDGYKNMDDVPEKQRATAAGYKKQPQASTAQGIKRPEQARPEQPAASPSNETYVPPHRRQVDVDDPLGDVAAAVRREADGNAKKSAEPSMQEESRLDATNAGITKRNTPSSEPEIVEEQEAILEGETVSISDKISLSKQHEKLSKQGLETVYSFLHELNVPAPALQMAAKYNMLNVLWQYKQLGRNVLDLKLIGSGGMGSVLKITYKVPGVDGAADSIESKILKVNHAEIDNMPKLKHRIPTPQPETMDAHNPNTSAVETLESQYINDGRTNALHHEAHTLRRTLRSNPTGKKTAGEQDQVRVIRPEALENMIGVDLVETLSEADLKNLDRSNMRLFGKRQNALRKAEIQRREAEGRKITPKDPLPNFATELPVIGTTVIEMPYFEGQTLTNLVELSQDDPLITTNEKIHMALYTTAKAATALKAVHEKGTVHRDIKPDNMIIGPNGEVYILDTGLARQRKTDQFERDETGAYKLDSNNKRIPIKPSERKKRWEEEVYTAISEQQSISGTPAYMSPEQTVNLPITSKSDVYSLACHLYTSITGKPLFLGGINIKLGLHGGELQGLMDEGDLSEKTPSRSYAQRDEVNANIHDKDLRKLLMDALEVVPQKRISMAEFETRLNDIMQKRSVKPKNYSREQTDLSMKILGMQSKMHGVEPSTAALFNAMQGHIDFIADNGAVLQLWPNEKQIIRIDPDGNKTTLPMDGSAETINDFVNDTKATLQESAPLSEQDANMLYNTILPVVYDAPTRSEPGILRTWMKSLFPNW